MKKEWSTPEMSCLMVEETSSGGDGEKGDNTVFAFNAPLTYGPS